MAGNTIVDRLRSKERQRRDVDVPLDASAAAAHRDAETAFDAAEAAYEKAKAQPQPTNAEARAAHRDVVARLLEARNAADRTVHETRADVENSTVTLQFQSIGRKAYDLLLAEHPATPAQDAEHREAFGQPAPYNADTFSVDLVAASLPHAFIDAAGECRLCRRKEDNDRHQGDVVTVEAVAEWQDEWNVAEFVPLWMAAIQVNTTSEVGRLGKASGRTSD